MKSWRRREFLGAGVTGVVGDSLTSTKGAAAVQEESQREKKFRKSLKFGMVRVEASIADKFQAESPLTAMREE